MNRFCKKAWGITDSVKIKSPNKNIKQEQSKDGARSSKNYRLDQVPYGEKHSLLTGHIGFRSFRSSF